MQIAATVAASLLRSLGSAWKGAETADWQGWYPAQLAARYHGGAWIASPDDREKNHRAGLAMKWCDRSAYKKELKRLGMRWRLPLRSHEIAAVMIGPDGTLDERFAPTKEKRQIDWQWFQLGFYEWQSRWIKAVRAKFGTSMPSWLSRLYELGRAVDDATAAAAHGFNPDAVRDRVNAQIELGKYKKEIASQLRQLRSLYLQTPAKKWPCKSKSGCKRFLEQLAVKHQAEAAAAAASAASEAGWYGIPTIETMDRAARAYRVVGAGAVLRYFSVYPDFMSARLRVRAPGALADVALAGLIRKAR